MDSNGYHYYCGWVWCSKEGRERSTATTTSHNLAFTPEERVVLRYVQHLSASLCGFAFAKPPHVVVCKRMYVSLQRHRSSTSFFGRQNPLRGKIDTETIESSKELLLDLSFRIPYGHGACRIVIAVLNAQIGHKERMKSH